MLQKGTVICENCKKKNNWYFQAIQHFSSAPLLDVDYIPNSNESSELKQVNVKIKNGYKVATSGKIRCFYCKCIIPVETNE